MRGRPRLADAGGFEPPPPGVKGRCSTVELRALFFVLADRAGFEPAVTRLTAERVTASPPANFFLRVALASRCSRSLSSFEPISVAFVAHDCSCIS